MITLPSTPDLLALAARCVWFQPPEVSLRQPYHLIAYVLTYGTSEDTRLLCQYVDEDGLREALAHAPPGIFDGRSWAYWQVRTGGAHDTPLPIRRMDN